MVTAMFDWMRFFFKNRRHAVQPVDIDRRNHPVAMNCKEANAVLIQAIERLQRALEDRGRHHPKD